LQANRPVDIQRLTATGRYWVRIAIALCCAMLLYILGRAIAGIFVDGIDVMSDDASVATVIAVATAVYFVLLAIPFMSAAELGVAMLVVFGDKASLPIYVAESLRSLSAARRATFSFGYPVGAVAHAHDASNLTGR
jgi:hypothetical protein